MYIGDLHIHSRYSRATSRDCTPEYLELWARKKGIHIIGTGDFTHPAWREELREKLEPAEDGLYVLKEEYRIGGGGIPDLLPRFVVTGEISSIYKKGERVRKVHSLLLLPGLEAAETLARRLELIGNIHSDGRPILGVPCRDLLEIMLETCPEGIYVPAHIWTPHFSLFGAFSGFDSIEECFEDLTPHIHALETGLSSDPAMNWRVGALDSFQLISNSDAHSPAKLGREANLFDISLSYEGLAAAIQEGKGLAGTIEFFPEEGKYHFDGHRKCGLCISPRETAGYGNRCPVCGKKITIGVLNRVEQLANREEGFIRPGGRPYESLVPLPEVIAASTGISAAGKKAMEQYERMIGSLGTEFDILRRVPLEDIRRAAGPLIAEGIDRLRRGEVERTPGFDGEYGKIGLLTPEDISSLEGQMSLFSLEELQAQRESGKEEKRRRKEQQQRRKEEERQQKEEEQRQEEGRKGKKAAAAGNTADGIVESAGAEESAPQASGETWQEDASNSINTLKHILAGLNDRQREAVLCAERAVAVIAGPGTGKTGTLIARLCYMMEERRIPPEEITAVTFTNRAAEGMRIRLRTRREGENAARDGENGPQIGTFHAICSRFLREQGFSFLIADEGLQRELAEEILGEWEQKGSSAHFLKRLSGMKNGLETAEETETQMYAAYQERLHQAGALDYDDLLLETLRLLSGMPEDAPERRSFSCLLIDEFQDINPLQHRLVEEWSRGGRELFVIGDPDQAIYGFRGSDAHCFTRLAAEYPGLRTIRLQENYRCAPEILSAALGVISYNEGGIRHMQAHRRGALPVRIVSAQDERREAIFVAKEINRQIGGIDMLDSEENSGREEKKVRGFSDIAVLYRTHRQAALLEKCLRQEGIPYVVAGREDFLTQREVRGALYFFRQVSEEADEAAHGLCLRLLQPWLGDAAEEKLALLTGRFRKKAEKEKPVKLLEAWMEEFHLEDNENMKKLVDMSVLHADMPEFLRTLSFGEDGDVRRNGGRKFTADAATLMTLHGSKGLEFPVVFLYGASQGRLPLEFGDTVADLEEERRLCFVGMTRAQEELILTCGPEPSRFLQEIPEETVRRETAGPEEKEEPQAVQLSLFDWL